MLFVAENKVCERMRVCSSCLQNYSHGVSAFSRKSTQISRYFRGGERWRPAAVTTSVTPAMVI